MMTQRTLQWGPTDRMRMRYIFIRLVELLLIENDQTSMWHDWLYVVFEWIDGSLVMDMYDKIVAWDYLRLIPPHCTEDGRCQPAPVIGCGSPRSTEMPVLNR